MKKAYIIRKGVSINQIKDLLHFIDNYKGGIIKTIYASDETSTVEKLMEGSDIALLFLGKENSNSKFEREISLTHSLGLRRAVFTLDENAYPSLTPIGIPFIWKMHCGYVHRATQSNILRTIRGATKWGV
ncbi:hypothetical protein CEE45_16155 [Candidatus Heimdallarchaeota archaeon B3_Heim]|nr:MAG: hypothetical protein CEE45_16155 [Candidatus Heimdallarchaeota archaeon B3_Heim]